MKKLLTLVILTSLSALAQSQSKQPAPVAQNPAPTSSASRLPNATVGAADDLKINKDSAEFYRRLWRIQIQEVAAKDAEIAELIKKQSEILTEKAKLLEENSRLKQGAVLDAMAADDAEILKARKSVGGKVNWKDLAVEPAPPVKADEKKTDLKSDKPKAE